MTGRRVCRDCGRPLGRDARRLTCATVCLVLGAVVSPGESAAQTPVRLTTAMPLPVESVASVVVEALFRLEPSQPALTESGPPTDRCAPLTCFRGNVVLRSNSRWQLQVRLDPSSGVTVPVSWLPTDAAGLPISGMWQAIGNGATPTPGLSVSLRFSTGGASAQRPTAAALSTALQFRVVPLP